MKKVFTQLLAILLVVVTMVGTIQPVFAMGGAPPEETEETISAEVATAPAASGATEPDDLPRPPEQTDATTVPTETAPSVTEAPVTEPAPTEVESDSSATEQDPTEPPQTEAPETDLVTVPTETVPAETEPPSTEPDVTEALPTETDSIPTEPESTEADTAPTEEPNLYAPTSDYVPEYIIIQERNFPRSAFRSTGFITEFVAEKVSKGSSAYAGFHYYFRDMYGAWKRGWGPGRTDRITHFKSVDPETGETNIAYCVQPHVDMPGGTPTVTPVNWDTDLWKLEYFNPYPKLPELGYRDWIDVEKRIGVTNALVYGAPNNGKTNDDAVFGTHLLILDVMCGYRRGDLELSFDLETTGIKAFWYYTGSKGERQEYENIVKAYRARNEHNNIPSFCSESRPSEVGRVLRDYNKDGTYTGSLTDSRNVLADYNFTSPIPGLTITRSGNTLNFSATKAAAKQLEDQGGVVLSATGKFYKIDTSESGDIRVYRASTNTQHMAMLVHGRKDPVPAYFSLTADVISEQKFSLYKGINASQSCIDQIKDNAMYTLAGAEYEVLMDGEQQEVLVTDENGYAASSKAYPIGTTLSIREIKAPSGFQLDKRTYSLTIKEGNNRIDVSDIPVFDPPFAITKVDKNTTTPQGNSSFYDAVFKWEYFDNASWSGAPKRTWYFRTNTQGRSEYNSKFLAPGYNSDPLYEKAPGNYQIPMGTVTITEIANPIGYVVVPHPLKCSIVQDGNDAKVKWEPDAWEYILDAAEGNFHIIEDIDKSLFGSLILDKIDSVSDAIPQGDGTLAGAKFEVVNNSANSVVVDGTTATPGEVCYEFTTDENGHFESGKIFPLGDYTVREAQAPDGHVLNSDWSGKFSITKDQNSASFTGPNACPDTPIYGGLKIIKQDADLGASTSADEPLDGIQFEIANASTNPVTVNGTSYANGETIMTLTIAWDGTQWSASTGPADLPYGTYTVTEVESKPGMANDYYQYDATVHTVEIREQDVVVEAVHQNPIAPGRIEIHKVDPIGKPLAGAKFCLEWSEDGSSWKPVESSESLIIKGGCTSPNLVDGCLVSGADGLVTFEGLYPTLQYRLTEVEAPDGYVLLSKPAFEGLLPVEDLTVTLTVHNSYGFTFPTTGSNAMQRMALIGTLITLLSGAAMIYPLRHWKGKLDK